ILFKKVLERNGFSRSEHLKNYEVYANVMRNSVVYEVILDFEAVIPEDEKTKQALESQTQKLQEASKVYGIKSKTYSVVRDARTPARDARKGTRDARTPARDARKGADQRLIEHEIARISPRSARMTREGKLSIALERSMRETEKEVRMPQGQFEGIINEVVGELKSITGKYFVPSLQKMLSKHVR